MLKTPGRRKGEMQSIWEKKGGCGGRQGRRQLFGAWSTVALSTLSFLAQLLELGVFTPDGYNWKLKSLHCDYPPAPAICAWLEHQVMGRVGEFGSSLKELS